LTALFNAGLPLVLLAVMELTFRSMTQPSVVTGLQMHMHHQFQQVALNTISLVELLFQI